MQYIVVLVEIATRFVFLIPVKNKTAKIIADVILSRYISFLGCPNNLHTDLGREFYNEIIKELCTSFHINYSFCAVDVHSSNMSERVIRNLNKFMRILTPQEFKKWSTFVPLFQVAENLHFHKSLGLSPFEAMTGRMISLPLSLGLPNPPLENTDVQDDLHTVFDKLLYHIYLSKGESLRIRSRGYSNKNKKFKPCDLVWLYIPPTKKVSVKLEWSFFRYT